MMVVVMWSESTFVFCNLIHKRKPKEKEEEEELILLFGWNCHVIADFIMK